MQIVDIHEAEARFSSLIQKAAEGEPFVIAKDGKPLVTVAPVGNSDRVSRLGF